MLVWLLHRVPWTADLAGLGKITFRGSLAALAAFLLAVLLGPWLIAWLRRRFREPIKSDSAEIQRLHEHKEATPTMGGLFLVPGVVAAVLGLRRSGQRLRFGGLGRRRGTDFIGRRRRLTKLHGASNGISATSKLAGQTAVALAAALVVYHQHAQLADGLSLHLPLVESRIAIGLWFIPLAAVVIVGSSNAVNLTDGLDGLAGGCLIFATAAHGSRRLRGRSCRIGPIPARRTIPGSGEMTVLAGAMVGGVLGFLWFNCHPAQVFLGDTGSLPLGGLLGLLAVVARQELLLAVVGGVFVVEAASVIIQVGVYKWASLAGVSLCPAAPPLPTSRLARNANRHPILDRRRAVCRRRLGQPEDQRRRPPSRTPAAVSDGKSGFSFAVKKPAPRDGTDVAIRGGRLTAGKIGFIGGVAIALASGWVESIIPSLQQARG